MNELEETETGKEGILEQHICRLQPTDNGPQLCLREETSPGLSLEASEQGGADDSVAEWPGHRAFLPGVSLLLTPDESAHPQVAL